MIIITATLSFETQEDRDVTVAKTGAVQRHGMMNSCLAYCAHIRPNNPFKCLNYGQMQIWARNFDHPNYAAMVEVCMGVMVASENDDCMFQRMRSCL